MRGALLFCFLVTASGLLSDEPAQPSTKDDALGSLRGLRTVAPPQLDSDAWSRNAIDQFVLANLERRDLKPNQALDEADSTAKTRLIRRVSFDISGLAPSQEEVNAFIRDERPDAYERLVDRLLASPHYGERWGRHWLDVARFGESHGYESDSERPTAWTFRDAVIHSLNEDVPYDRFVRWQIAGDQLAEEHPLAVPLSGFLAAGPTVTNVDAVDREKAMYDKMDDIVSATGTSFLGLTIGCARCHDHKFDPISAKDYYRMVGFFLGGSARDTSFASANNVDPSKKVKGLTWSGGGRKHNPILLRGNVDQKGDNVGQGAPSAFGPSAENIGDRKSFAAWLVQQDQGAGALAARVVVNRLWQHHFGRGLVKTSNNFGSLGERPSHPDLLEWLAAELIRNDWRLKPIHRLMLTSATYTQDTTWDERRHKIDPTNAYLWRWQTRRLEAETIRDSILNTAGTLNRKIGGPSVRPWVSKDAIGTGSTNKWPVNVKDGPQTWRRGVYIFMRRSMRMPFLETFDAPDAMSSRGRRELTTVAPQALIMMNNRFVRDQAEYFARRVIASIDGNDRTLDAKTHRRAVVEEAYWLAFSRAPSPDELELGIDFLSKDKLVNLCHALLTLNEFVYLD